MVGHFFPLKGYEFQGSDDEVVPWWKGSTKVEFCEGFVLLDNLLCDRIEEGVSQGNQVFVSVSCWPSTC